MDGSSSKSKIDMVPFTVRLPRSIHTRIREMHEERPHISMNSIMIELLERGTAKQDFDFLGTQLDVDALKDSSLLAKVQ